MPILLRVLAALALALALALPAVGDEGGENSGGMGVWVLPRPSFVPPLPAVSRATRPFSITRDCVLQLSADCGPASGTIVDDVTGVPVALQVSGSTVRIPAALLQALAQDSTSTATAIISDSQQLGYVIKITFTGQGSASVTVY